MFIGQEDKLNFAGFLLVMMIDCFAVDLRFVWAWSFKWILVVYSFLWSVIDRDFSVSFFFHIRLEILNIRICF